METSSLVNRKREIFDLFDSGWGCIPGEPFVESSLLRNNYKRLLISSPTSDEYAVVYLLRMVGPMSLSEIQTLLQQRIHCLDSLVNSGVLQRTNVVADGYRLTGATTIDPLHRSSRSPRPPTRAETKRILSWVVGHVRETKRELPSELLWMLRWVQDVTEAPTHVAHLRKILRGKLPHRAIEQLVEMAKEDAENGTDTDESGKLIRWLEWSLTDRDGPCLVPFWPDDDEDESADDNTSIQQ